MDAVMATNFRGESVALAFRNGLEYRNGEGRDNSGDD